MQEVRQQKADVLEAERKPRPGVVRGMIRPGASVP